MKAIEKTEEYQSGYKFGLECPLTMLDVKLWNPCKIGSVAKRQWFFGMTAGKKDQADPKNHIRVLGEGYDAALTEKICPYHPASILASFWILGRHDRLSETNSKS